MLHKSQPQPAPCVGAVRRFARIHAFYQLCRFTSPPQPTPIIAMQAPLVLAALLFPSKATLVGSAMANVVVILMHLPAVVDMDHWALHTDVALLSLLASRGDAGCISFVIRTQLAIFYGAAGLWKATVDHADPKLSCSTLLLVQTLVGWLPPTLLRPWLVAAVAANAPTITLVVETLIAPLLLFGGRGSRSLGVLLVLALHIGIMIAPLPLSIADFGAVTPAAASQSSTRAQSPQAQSQGSSSARTLPTDHAPPSQAVCELALAH